MTRGLLLDGELWTTCVEWGRVSGIGHPSWHIPMRLTSWWANSIPVNGHDAPGSVLLCDCRMHLRVALLKHTKLLHCLGTWGTDLQRTAYRGNLQLMWSGQLAPGFYVHICFLWANLLFEDNSLFHASIPRLFPWRCRLAWLWLRKRFGGGWVIISPPLWGA